MLSKALCRITSCSHCLAHHPAIIARLLELKDTEQARKSHYFGGRYENIYIETAALPGIDTILHAALTTAADILDCKPDVLQLSFWFNLMQQHDVTLPHTHDVDDEVLSATYYLQIPPDAGKLILHLPDGPQLINPVEGQFVFFDPALEHEVTTHPHPRARISLGLNLGYRTPD